MQHGQTCKHTKAQEAAPGLRHRFLPLSSEEAHCIACLYLVTRQETDEGCGGSGSWAATAAGCSRACGLNQGQPLQTHAGGRHRAERAHCSG